MLSASQKTTLFKFVITSAVFMVGVICFSAARAQDQKSVSMKVADGYRVIVTQGIPHYAAQYMASTGIRPQSYRFKVSAKPQRAAQASLWEPGMFFGVALDGVPFAQGVYSLWNDNPLWLVRLTKDSYDGHGGHLTENQAYVYSAIPTDLVSKDLSHVGYAADGFPIFVSKGNKFKSSYRLKKGDRPEPPKGPGGAHSGDFYADYEYVPRSGNLDACNGILVKGKYYIYVLTPEFPRIPLCWSGTPDQSFVHANALLQGAQNAAANPGPREEEDPSLRGLSPREQRLREAGISR